MHMNRGQHPRSSKVNYSFIFIALSTKNIGNDAYIMLICPAYLSVWVGDQGVGGHDTLGRQNKYK